MSKNKTLFRRLLETKALVQYDAGYARGYRKSDEVGLGETSHRNMGKFVDAITADLHSGARVLDFGCGSGRYFHHIHRPVHCIGLDLSVDMLNEARHPVNEEGISAHIGLVCGSVFEPPFEAGVFDLVYSIGLIGHHLPLEGQLLREVHRLLKPGGLFGFTADDANSPKVTSWRHELALLVRRIVPKQLRPWIDARLHEFRIHEPELKRLLQESSFQEVNCSRHYSPTGRIDLTVVAKAVHNDSAVSQNRRGIE